MATITANLQSIQNIVDQCKTIISDAGIQVTDALIDLPDELEALVALIPEPEPEPEEE